MSCARSMIGLLPRAIGCAGLLAWAFAGTVALAATSPETAAKVSRLIEASGIGFSARQIPPGMVSGFDEPQQGVPDNVRGALREAALLAFHPDPIIERVRARLGTTLTNRQLDDTLAWLDAPLGRRITGLENAAAEPSAAGRIKAYGGEIGKRPPTKRRAELIAGLIVASGTGELNAVVLESAILATSFGINAAQPVQLQQPVEQVRQQVKASLPQLLKESEQELKVSMLYTYRSLSDPEIESYLKFLKSASGVAYTKGAVAGLRDAMLESMGRFMQAIPKSLANQKNRVGT